MRDYGALTELAKIITNSNLDYQNEVIRDIFAYWLAGYENDCAFGCYINWKEMSDEIAV